MNRYRLAGLPGDAELELLRRALARRGWRETAGEDWDLLWSGPIPDGAAYAARRPEQRINHLPGSVTLHYKDELAHFLAAAGATCHPRTWSMPGDFAAWRAVAAAEPGTIWIVKPKRLAHGEGIRLTRDPATIAPDPDVIVQEYVADPLLLPGWLGKHVVRVYALITSLMPLMAWLHPDGPVKIASRPFGTSDTELADLARHLTNPAVQREAGEVLSVDMAEYRRRLAAAGHDPDALWERVRSAVATVLEAHAEPMLRASTRVTPDLDGCFELVGFDVLVDAGLRPWVLECNVSPALGARGAPGSPHHAAQRRAKAAMVDDVVGLILHGDPGAFEPVTPGLDRGPAAT